MTEPMRVPPRCEFELDKLVLKLDEVVSSDVSVIDNTVAKIMGLIERADCWYDLDTIDLALREALVNAIIHGNRSSPSKAVRICVALQEGCGILIVVKDAGSGFDPSKLPNPVEGQNILATHGRGIFLINQLMSDVRFRFESGTAIYMTRRHPDSKPGTPIMSAGSLSRIANSTEKGADMGQANPARAVVAGVIATAVMTLLMMMAPKMGMPEMPIARMLGSMFFPIERAMVPGMIIHFMMGGAVFGLAYAWLLEPRLPGPSAVRGLIYGAILWIVAGLMMPVVGLMHPLIKAGQMPSPGLFMIGMGGMMAVMGSLMGHLLYGVVLGGIYKRKP